MVRKYISQADQLIKYFESMKKEGFKFPRLIDGLKESKKIIVGSILDELNSVTKLALAECRSVAYEKADQWNKSDSHGQSKAHYDAKKLIASNPNLIKAKKMITLLKSLEIKDKIIINAELIIEKIEKSLSENYPADISIILNK